MTILQGNSRSIAQKSGEIWTGQADLQPIYFKSDRLLGADPQPYGVYGKGLQRRMAEKDAVSCFVIFGS